MNYLKILFLFIGITAFAQESKVGTIDVDFVLSKMPELEGVQKQVDDYRKGLEDQLNKKVQDLEAQVKVYKENEASFTILQKQQKQDSLLVMENEIGKFRQNGNQLIMLKQEEYMQPLYNKVGEALEKVAQAGGYTQVLLRNNDVVYVDNRFDLTIAVLKEMGIEVKPEE